MAKGNIMRLIKQNYKGANYKRNKGIAILWAAFTLLLLILFMGLAIDGGVLFFSAHQLQNAADAAALAGARIVRVDQHDSRVQAQLFGGLNYCLGDFVALNYNGDNVPDGDIVVGRFYYDERGFVPLQDLPEGVEPDALKVVTKRTADEHGAVPLYFGPIVNVNTADVSRVAVAQALGGWGAGIIALDCYAPGALSIGTAATDLNLIAGGIQVNSNADDAFYTNINTEYDPIPDNINVNGGVVENKFPDVLYDVTTLGAPRMPDPLCPDAECDGSVSGGDCLPEPAFGPVIQEETVRGSTDPCNPKTIGPGYYPGGIELLSSDETLYLDPGIYILDAIGANKGGLYINGGNLYATDGVMFYITGDGKVDMQGNGTVQINTNSEIESGTYAGMAIFQDRDNLNDASIHGTGTLDIVGTIYFPQNHVLITGTGDGFGTQLIANTIEISGTGTMQINYDGRNPFPANRSILVY